MDKYMFEKTKQGTFNLIFTNDTGKVIELRNLPQEISQNLIIVEEYINSFKIENVNKNLLE